MQNWLIQLKQIFAAAAEKTETPLHVQTTETETYKLMT